MHWQYSPYLVPLLVAAFISAAIANSTHHRRTAPGARPFFVLMVAVAIWSFGYALELSSRSLPAILFWIKFEYIGIVSIPVAWFLFALEYTGQTSWLPGRKRFLLTILPLISLLLVWSSPLHGLMYRSLGLQMAGQMVILGREYGPWFWLHTAYAYVLLLLGTLLLFQKFFRSGHLYRTQNGIVLLGALIPWVANALYLSQNSPFPALDLTPFAFTASGALLWQAFTRYRLLDIVPVARTVLIESMSEGVLVLDSQHRVVDMNPAAERITGEKLTTAIGHPISQLFPEHSALIETRCSSNPAEIEIVMEEAWGPRHFDVHISPLFARPRALSGHLLILHDITARIQTEAALKEAKEEAEQASRAKSAFLSRVSHELRTPLNAILGFAQLLAMDPLDNEQQAEVEQILKGGNHLLKLINEVLDLSRIESGHLRLSLEAVRPDELVAECSTLLQPLADRLAIAMRIERLAPPETRVLADRQRLKQVVLNLLANAIKYNRPGGTIELRYSLRDGARLQIRIRDTGYGIRPEKLERLFSPFDRLGAERSEVEGSGLGLALAKGMIEAMGGTIGVESEVNSGSTFWIELPIVVGEERRSELPSDRLGDPNRKPLPALNRTVLYIEDNPSNLALVERLLTRHLQARLIAANQGSMGLELARAHMPNLILLDLDLPDLPGETVMHQLKNRMVTRTIPIVVISAGASQSDIDRLLAAGAAAYLAKPLDVAEFVATVQGLLPHS